jgi:hypothetical protein
MGWYKKSARDARANYAYSHYNGRPSPQRASQARGEAYWDAESQSMGGSYSQHNWTGSKNKGRWQMKYAGNLETNKRRISARKATTEKQLYAGQLKAWKGNEWMNKALNEAWEKDYKGYRSMNLSRVESRERLVRSEVEDQYHVTPGGYRGLDKEGLNQFAHEMAGRAQQMHSEHIRSEESAKRMGARKARGGMGNRGSTIMTGGHKGVLEEAKTKKQTLIGV